MANYTHKVFFTETRGLGTYTRVQIDIEGDKEPLVIGFDIPGSSDKPQEVIDSCVADRVAQLVVERSNANLITQDIINTENTQDITVATSKIQEQLNAITEPAGMTAIVIPIEQMTSKAVDDIKAIFVAENIDADIKTDTVDKIRVIDDRRRVVGTGSAE